MHTIGTNQRSSKMNRSKYRFFGIHRLSGLSGQQRTVEVTQAEAALPGSNRLGIGLSDESSG